MIGKFSTITLLLGISFLWISSTLTAQDLKRKASLGISLQAMNDSLSTINQVKKGKGIYVIKVFPNTTASNLGMKDGAIVTQINDHSINSMNDLFGSIGNLRANDKLTITFYQNGKKHTKSTKAVARPKEQFEKANIEYGVVRYSDNNLRSILYTPKGRENPPVVYFLQGYTCQSTEFAQVPDLTIMKLIQDWVSAGYAVYRVEKANMGDSECEKGCMEQNFHEELEGFRQGYLNLQQNSKVDAENIFLFGHSMGGIIAPLLAKEFEPKGVITYGIIINTWFEYMQEMTRVQGEMFHTPYEEIERDIRTYTPFWYEMLTTHKTNLEILENKQIKEALEAEGSLEEFRSGYFLNRHYTYWQTLQKISLIDTWVEVNSKVLALYGEFDIEALNANHIKTLAAVVNSKHPGNASYQVVKNTDHGFVNFDTMEANINAHVNGEYGARLRDSYSPKVAECTITWMNGHLK